MIKKLRIMFGRFFLSYDNWRSCHDAYFAFLVSCGALFNTTINLYFNYPIKIHSSYLPFDIVFNNRRSETGDK